MTTGIIDPTSADPRTTRERILDAAEQVFAEKGLGAAPVRDIAGRVGLNPASLYNHFAGKEELYEAVLERGLTPVLEMLSDLMSGTRTRDREELVMDRVVRHFAASPNLAKLIHYETLAGGERLATIAGRFFEPVYQRGIDAMRDSRAAEIWPAEEIPLLVLAFQNIIVGYFAMAPLVQQVFGLDPLSEDGLSRQLRFLHKMTNLLIPPREA